MLQTAVFVDAGYFFAAGSALLWGEKQPRHLLTLDTSTIVETLIVAAKDVEPHARLLRIYWYDGIAQNRGPSAEQSLLAHTPNIKLRLGFLNSQGQQKGVDSLIVTDLIDLARNGAISDALILAGDEDLRVGVQVAQTYGVRVHLLGIKPSRGNQSRPLSQEVDGMLEWTEAELKTLVTRTAPEPIQTTKPLLDQPKANDQLDTNGIIEAIYGRFDAVKMAQFREHVDTTGSLPRDVDAPLLAQARDTIGRDLETVEKRQLRNAMIAKVRAFT
jgi:hypothetical protein